MRGTHTELTSQGPFSHVCFPLDIQRLHERVVPVCILAVHAPCGWAGRAVSRRAHAIEEVRHLAVRIEPQLGPFPRRHGDGLAGGERHLRAVRRRAGDVPSACDDVIRRAHVSRKQRAAASRDHWWIASPPRLLRGGDAIHQCPRADSWLPRGIFASYQLNPSSEKACADTVEFTHSCPCGGFSPVL